MSGVVPGPNRPPVSAWLRRVYQEVSRNRHVILFGNIDDRVLLDGDYLDFHEAMNAFLAVLGFELTARFNPVDGFGFASEAQRRSFDQLVWPARGNAAGPATSAPAPPSAAAGAASPAGAEPSGNRRARAEESRNQLLEALQEQPSPEVHQTTDALAALRRGLAQSQLPCAFVVEFAELMIGNIAPAADDYRGHLLQLRKAMAEAARVRSPQGTTVQNTLIVVTKHLASLPEWLHRDNPLVAVVEVTKPDQVERRTFLEHSRIEFFGGEELTEPEAGQVANTLSNLTHGMSIRDLQALQTTSQLVEIPFREPKRLVLHHRFGLRTDPWEQLDMDKVRDAHQILSQRVIGQEAAIGAVAEMLVNARVGIEFTSDVDSSSTRPKGVFFFVGPTGVGKTELAKAIAEFVFDDEAAIHRFDMSEFGQEHTSERLTGAPPGYVGHEQGGMLTNCIIERPFSVLLFDEIEKAHHKVLDKFLQIIDDGRLTDGQGTTVYFSHTVVIFTSNLGAQQLHEELRRSGNDEPPYGRIEKLFRQAVHDHLAVELGRPELLGRLGRGIVVFDVLRRPVVAQITRKFLDQLARSARARGYRLHFDYDGITKAVQARLTEEGAALGARLIRDPILEQLVRAPLTAWIAANQPPPGTRIWVRRAEGGQPFTVEEWPSDNRVAAT